MTEKVTNPLKVTTDPVLLSALAKQGIDKDYVEFVQDYAPHSLGKGHSPYAKFYRDLKSNKRFMVVSGLPMCDADGVKIEVGWKLAGINYFSEKNNLFRSKVQGTQVEITIRNDQPDGRKAGDKLTFKPQLFLAGLEVLPSDTDATRLPVDTTNLNYINNVLEWDYGICKRRLRIIEGSVLGTWVFNSKPTGTIRIKYNQTGDYKLKLGQFKINDDEEQITPDQCDELSRIGGYPVTISDSSTFYPDAHAESTSVDGAVLDDGNTLSWANIIAEPGSAGYPSAADGGFNYHAAHSSISLWNTLARAIFLFDTSALPDDATISAAVLSLRGKGKADNLTSAPDLNIYSSAPASNTDLVAGDFDSLGSTPLSDTAITYAGWDTAAYNDFTLNATGIAAISKTSISKLGARGANHDVAASAPNWIASQAAYLEGYYSEQGDGYKPKLVVTYTVATIVTPTTLALTLTTYAPSIISGTVVTPTTLALTLTTYAPTIDTTVTPSTLALNITTYSAVTGYGFVPSTLALALTTYAPIILGQYKVEVDWNNDGDFTDTYDDITADVKTIHFSRGKSDELGKAEVGQLSITLNNADAKYTPGAGGVISASLLPKRPIKVTNASNSLFYGFIEEIIPHPHLTEQDCIITATDGLDFLSRHDMATALYKDTLTGLIHGYILDDAGWSATMRALDDGLNTIPYWYGADVKARFAQEEIDDNEPGFSYIDGAGYFRFEDRNHRALHITPSATFDNTMANITYSLNPKNIYNIIKVTVTPWTIQNSATLWTLTETVAPPLLTGETKTWWGEASVSGNYVFVDTWAFDTNPVTTTDYTANSLVGGGGDDETTNVAVTVTNFAKTIKLVVKNNAAHTVYLTLLRARGTYYDDQTKVTLKSENTASQTAYQKRTLPIDGKYMTTADTARDFADFLLSRYREPQAEVTISLVNKNSTLLTNILSLEISDRITVKNTKLNLNQDFFIDYMEHDISMSGLLHTVTYRVIPGTNEDMWVWDVDIWDVGTKWGY